MGWGGKRNSASRTSDSLSLSQAINILEAARYAAAAGMPFNRHVTIHWEQAGLSDDRAAWATGRFLKLVGDWVASRSLGKSKVGTSRRQIAWAWVRENGKRKGSHVHILLHLPDGLRIGPKQRRWLRLVTGKPYHKQTIKTVRIGGTAAAAERDVARYEANLGTVVAYLLKGTAPADAFTLGLERLEAGGRIIGKRAATSQNVGRRMRGGSRR